MVKNTGDGTAGFFAVMPERRTIRVFPRGSPSPHRRAYAPQSGPSIRHAQKKAAHEPVEQFTRFEP